MLGLKNEDNKAIVGILVSLCQRVSQASTHFTQRGFVSGRQLASNVVDLDAAGRIFGNNVTNHNMMHSPSPFHLKCALVAFFYFATAFPSVIDDRIFLALRARGVPQGLIDFSNASIC